MTALELNHTHGGYSPLEQPLNAMSWDEPFVEEAPRNFLTESAIISHCRTLDAGESPLKKCSQFISNIYNFSMAELQCTCDYKHTSFAGSIEPDGTFSSHLTAEYPINLVLHLTPFLRLDLPTQKEVQGFLEWASFGQSLVLRTFVSNVST